MLKEASIVKEYENGKQVLILILMEHAQRKGRRTDSASALVVLILILMEHAQRATR